MGIINHDNYTTSYGIDVTDSYISIGTHNLEVSKDETNYILRYIVTIWASQSDRNDNKRSLQVISREINISSAQLSTSLYELAYSDLKTIFKNSTDV